MDSIRATRAEIDLTALGHNFRIARSLAGDSAVMAVVKAEAYGHGLIEIARALIDLKVDYLGVSFLEEGIALREAGIGAPILVMGGLVDEQIELFLDHDLDITVSSVWKARQVNRIAAGNRTHARVHLKIDTGMGRVGQNWQTAGLLFDEVLNLPKLDVRGLYTHLATADEEDLTYAYLQLDRFTGVIGQAEKRGIRPPLVHAANSGALMQVAGRSRYGMVRPGLMLYGWAPARHLEGRYDLRPVMSLKTRAVYVKRPSPDFPIGYGATWRSPGNTWIATLPIGYGDGYPRLAGNRSVVLHRGARRSVVGRVSMDQITIDAGLQAYLGDEVLLFGRNAEGYLSIWELCEVVDTIPYEILCGIAARVPRIYASS